MYQRGESPPHSQPHSARIKVQVAGRDVHILVPINVLTEQKADKGRMAILGCYLQNTDTELQETGRERTEGFPLESSMLSGVHHMAINQYNKIVQLFNKENPMCFQ